MLKDTIRRLRKAKGLTQKQVADAIGVSAAAVTYWEKGGGIDIPNLKKLAKALGCPPKVLIDESGDTQSQETNQTVQSADDRTMTIGNNAHVASGTNSNQEGVDMGDDGVSGGLKDAVLKDILARLARLEGQLLDKHTGSAETSAGPQKRRRGL